MSSRCDGCLWPLGCLSQTCSRYGSGSPGLEPSVVRASPAAVGQVTPKLPALRLPAPPIAGADFPKRSVAGPTESPARPPVDDRSAKERTSR
eukprot:CAMPEP_0115517562 /NCGR_PEP_ID=MMETSP0271-20121206/77385_1 /TAXON_ID=71861 /ORGANISM="Scrippsiella trochoidea, Strain CCMP3099" /LENGTH=91 /DNA_ID=CAMNT_0002948347 /DNA_START=37 /DNA_END=308 /DNA_ORIENTATION=-